MQWILLLIQMNAGVADLHYLELYETFEQCTADMWEIEPRLESHEVMICILVAMPTSQCKHGERDGEDGDCAEDVR